MDPDADFTYTEGLTDADVDRLLRETASGVLALANDGDAYAVPVFHHYEDDSLFFRLGETSDSNKAEYIETTETATYVLYDTEATADAPVRQGWSILAQGPIRALPADDPAYDSAAINDRFAPIRVFDEALDEIDFVLYELRIKELTGRRN